MVSTGRWIFPLQAVCLLEVYRQERTSGILPNAVTSIDWTGAGLQGSGTRGGALVQLALQASVL